MTEVATVPSARVKAFPIEHLARRPVLTYPEGLECIEADTVEIGPGKGELLLLLAAGDPTRRFAAIEVSHERFVKLIHRVETAGLTNVQLVNGDARVVWPRWIAPGSLETVIALFPDPWPKRRHAFHRLLTREFLQTVALTLKPGGELLIKTDSARYAATILAHASEVSGLRIVNDADGSSATQAALPSTYYESKQAAAGLTIHYLCLVRMI